MIAKSILTNLNDWLPRLDSEWFRFIDDNAELMVSYVHDQCTHDGLTHIGADIELFDACKRRGRFCVRFESHSVHRGTPLEMSSVDFMTKFGEVVNHLDHEFDIQMKRKQIAEDMIPLLNTKVQERWLTHPKNVGGS